ncbi:hypothetical protein BJY52DRAFT_932941 [Lactarius psammicola]|nr:hypothetical protein BJY52DRAFT_932941 [Lactarius psammicola]
MTIAKSAPHVYLSALLFAPTDSPVAALYSSSFPRTLRVERGRLSYWPSSGFQCWGWGPSHSILTRPVKSRFNASSAICRACSAFSAPFFSAFSSAACLCSCLSISLSNFNRRVLEVTKRAFIFFGPHSFAFVASMTSKIELQTPSPPKGLPELPGPTSGDDTGNTPRSPGAWAATPAPAPAPTRSQTPQPSSSSIRHSRT